MSLRAPNPLTREARFYQVLDWRQAISIALSVITCGIARLSAQTPASMPHGIPDSVTTDSLQAIQSCRNSGDTTGDVVLVGTVMQADTLVPIDSATISLTWREVDLSPSGLSKQEKRFHTVTGADGHYHICGLPDELDANFQLIYHDYRSPMLRVIAAPHQKIVRQNITIPTDSMGHAVLHGYVLTADGHPIPGAAITLISNKSPIAYTDTTGAFTLTALPSGTQEVSIRALRYVPVVGFVELRAKTPVVTKIQLDTQPTMLQAVVVSGQQSPRAAAAGFYDRLKTPKSLGRFITPEDIQKSKPVAVMDLFRHMPGLWIYNNQGEDSVGALPSRSSGPDSDLNPSVLGQRTAKIYIDGILATQNDIRNLLPDQITGIEVYRDARTAPKQYSIAGPGGADETVIVLIWTSVGEAPH